MARDRRERSSVFGKTGTTETWPGMQELTSDALIHTDRASDVHRFLTEGDWSIQPDSITISRNGGRFELQCLIVADSLAGSEAVNRIAVEIAEMTDVEGFRITHASRT